jgi:acyl-CoA thioester hydrolase
MQLRVYYEDTDAGGIVYHTNYIKYCERARSELFFEKNMIPTDGENSNFVVRHIDAHFLGMAYLGDMLDVTTELVKKKRSSFILKQSVFNRENKVFEMDVLLVFVREGKPARIPQHLLEIIIQN